MSLYNIKELLAIGGKVVKMFSDTKAADGDTCTIPLDVMLFKEGTFFLNVIAGSGTTPKLDVTIESKDPSGDKWHPIATFTQATGVTNEHKDVSANLGNKIAVKYVISGTDPSFTFSVYVVLKIK